MMVRDMPRMKNTRCPLMRSLLMMEMRMTKTGKMSLAATLLATTARRNLLSLRRLRPHRLLPTLGVSTSKAGKVHPHQLLPHVLGPPELARHRLPFIPRALSQEYSLLTAWARRRLR